MKQEPIRKTFKNTERTTAPTPENQHRRKRLRILRATKLYTTTQVRGKDSGVQ